MKELYWSEKDKTAFWIAGYTDNTQIVKVLIEILQTHLTTFQTKLPPYVKPEEIKTMVFRKAYSKFSGMRIFWATGVDDRPSELYKTIPIGMQLFLERDGDINIKQV